MSVSGTGGLEARARGALAGLYARRPELRVCERDIAGAAELLKKVFAGGGKLLIAGNGGSAADALHIVGELMKGFALERKLAEGERARFAGLPDGGLLADNLQSALPAVSLIGELSLATAYANDKAPELAFAQQTYGLATAGDAFLGITTSGNSGNILYAAQAARAKGAAVIGLTGAGGGKLRELCDVCVRVPETETYKIQELHLPVYHAICLALEQEFFGGG
jgi:D-sedoheptulose 7-phosphate isomerase